MVQTFSRSDLEIRQSKIVNFETAFGKGLNQYLMTDCQRFWAIQSGPGRRQGESDLGPTLLNARR